MDVSENHICFWALQNKQYGPLPNSLKITPVAVERLNVEYFLTSSSNLAINWPFLEILNVLGYKLFVAIYLIIEL